MLTRPTEPGERGGFSGHRFAGFSLLPWRYVRVLTDSHDELVHRVWRPAEAAGELELVPYDGLYIDTGTPADYLRANLHAAGGGSLVDPSATVTGPCAESVVGAGAIVRGSVTRCVVWPGGVVTEDEHLSDTIRAVDGVSVPAPGRAGFVPPPPERR
jgi:mannose-1-phosphate guanylyltransferase/MurNAc alpha-1-phosphate uridylyltransferase